MQTYSKKQRGFLFSREGSGSSSLFRKADCHCCTSHRRRRRLRWGACGGWASWLLLLGWRREAEGAGGPIPLLPLPASHALAALPSWRSGRAQRGGCSARPACHRRGRRAVTAAPSLELLHLVQRVVVCADARVVDLVKPDDDGVADAALVHGHHLARLAVPVALGPQDLHLHGGGGGRGRRAVRTCIACERVAGQTGGLSCDCQLHPTGRGSGVGDGSCAGHAAG